MNLKNIRRGRISEYADKFPKAVYTAVDPDLDYNPLWNHKADCAFPSATQNEINGKDAQNLVEQRCVPRFRGREHAHHSRRCSDLP